MTSNNLIHLLNKCSDNECVKVVSQNFMLSKVFGILFAGIFICLGLFILCKYFKEIFE